MPNADRQPAAAHDAGGEWLAQAGHLTGSLLACYEQAFCAFLGEPQLECVAASSTSDALRCAFRAIRLGPGDEVITTVHGEPIIGEIAHGLECDVKLVDIDPATLNIDIAAIEAAITPRTKAILAMHYGGLAVDMIAILDIARHYGLRVIEDASHAFSATLEKELIGTLGSDAAVYSFGEGVASMLVTRNTEIAQLARDSRWHGVSDDSAGAGLRQLDCARNSQARREHIAKRFDQAFVKLPLILPPPAPQGDTHAWQLYVLRLADEARISREAFVERLYAAGVKLAEQIGPTSGQLPQSRRAFERSVCLQLDAAMTDADVQQAIEAVRSCLAH